MKWILLFFIPYFSLAFVPAGDNDYFILEEKQYRIIFDRQYLNSIDQINQKIKKQIAAMSKFKKRTLDEPINVILFSPKSQISNAFATILPFYTIGMFPTGIAGLERLSESSWMDDVFEHELNHVFQLSHSNIPLFWRKIFKFPLMIFPLFPFKVITPFPNIRLPRFILEGDAVLKESFLSHKGGRLYDGAARAFVYSQIRHYQYQTDELIKKMVLFSVNNPHVGKEIYLHGGYLMAMLAEKYSQDDIHSFFTPDKKEPSKEEIKKFKEEKVGQKLSPAFGKIFSFKYLSPFIKGIVKAYFNRYLSEASKQSYSTNPVLFESSACHPFNQSEDEIFFLTSDFKSTPSLRIFNKKSQKWSHQKIDLPLGKVFKIDDKFYSRSSEYVAPNTVHYSLFSKGLISNKTFDSKYVTDIKKMGGGKTLAIDTKNNIEGFKLYLNDKYYTDVHSTALFDKKGNVFYFKQREDTRTLYKNKSPLFSYKGYYGKLVEIDSKGIIYFLGASPYGSSIYQYHSGKISRSVSSDTVVQAQKINDKEFIVCEVTPYNYEYKIATQALRSEQPVLYKYNFKKNSLVSHKDKQSSNRQLASEINNIKSSKVKGQKENKQNTESLVKPYSGWGKLRFAGGSLTGIVLGLGNALGGTFVLSDYLMHNFILLYGASVFNYEFEGWESPVNFFSLTYLNKTYRLNWSLGYNFFSYSKIIGDYKLYRSGNISSGYLYLKYPLIKEGRWSALLSSIHFVKKSKNSISELPSGGTVILRGPSGAAIGIKGGPTRERQTTETESLIYQSRGSLYMGYDQSFPFNYLLSNKSLGFQFFLDHKKYNPSWKGLKGGVIGQSLFHVGQNFYWTSSASYASSLDEKINPATTTSYSRTYPKDFDKKEISNIHSNVVTDDTSIRSFILGDLANIFAKKQYSAKSIGTFGMGIKKMFSLSSFNIFTASFRSRYLIFENLYLQGFPLLALPEGDTVELNPQAQTLSDIVRIFDREEEEFAKYTTHWLEWTFGLEYTQLLDIFDLRNGIVIGASFGFRTPVKFWKAFDESALPTGSSSDIGSEDSEGGSIQMEKEQKQGTTSSSEEKGDTDTDTPSEPKTPESTKALGSSLKSIDPSFQLYIKIPF